MIYLLLFFFLTQPAHARQTDLPVPQGVVNDFAGMLDASSIADMEKIISDFKRKTTVEIAVVTIPTFEPYPSLEEYASELFKTWKIGKTKENNGILLIAAKKEKRIRIEVGYGLEEFIPDGLAGEIIRNQVRPYFREERFGPGMKQGVESIIRILAQKKGIPLDRKAQESKKSILDSPLFLDGLIFLLFFFFILSRLIFSSSSRRNGPGGFWGSGGGGFGGGFGGFGGFGGSGEGGFGGFGGGGSGGGGASNNWVL